MGRKIETTRKHARKNMAAIIDHGSKVAVRPAELNEAYRMSGKATSIRAAIDAGLLPASMGEVADLLSIGSSAIRELDELQRVRRLMTLRGRQFAEAYCTENQLVSLDEVFLGWREHV